MISCYPHVRSYRISRGFAAAIVTCLFFVQIAAAKSRSSLQIFTDPDSAEVMLDGATSPELQKTPYVNDKMLPGTHTIFLRSPNSAYKPILRTIFLEAEQDATLSETFEYRTKAFHAEHLSLAPWKLEVASGFEYLRYIGYQSAGSLSANKSTLSTASSYSSDSIPTSLRIPVTMRLGLPWGLETHFLFPLAKRTEIDGSSKGIGFSDATMGIKWTYQALNSALDMTWVAGNALASRLGSDSKGLQLSIITNQNWSQFDLFGQLGYRKNFSNMDSGAIGDAILARLRIGYLLRNRFLPFLEADADGQLANTYGTVTPKNSSYVLTFEPGFIWQVSPNLSTELGVPLGLIAKNAETRWGVNMSLACEFALFKDAKAASSKVPSVAQGNVSAYGYATSQAQPTSAGIHLLFDSHEVTNAQYRQFCEKTGHEHPTDPDFSGMPNYFDDPQFSNYPVVNISIEDARAYASWIGKRLPTVTEWTREFSEATMPATRVACGLDAPESATSRYQGGGMYNYIGNVAEWVESDRGATNSAYIAGGFYSLPTERCLDKTRMIDIASPTGSKFIGFRLVTEIK